MIGNRVTLLLIAGFLLLPLVWVEAQEAVEKKTVPDAATQGKVEALITKLFDAKFKAAKSDKTAALALATELLTQGKATKDDDSLQFMALKLAGELAAAAGDQGLALEAVGELAKSFKLDTLDLKSAIYAQAEKGITDKEDALTLVDAVLQLVEEALALDNFTAAEKLLGTAEKAATKSEKLAWVARVEKRTRELDDARKAFADIKPLLAKVGSDENATLSVGKYYCFVKGNYDKGLPLLAKSKDMVLKALAERDLAKPQEPKMQVALADDWYSLAESGKGLSQRQTFHRAWYWYQLALPKLEGLTRVRVDRLVAQLANLFPAKRELVLAVREITAELRVINGGHNGVVQSLSISSDGKWILSGGQSDNIVRLWDATTGQKIRDFAGHTAAPTGVAISADKKWGLSASSDGTLRVWDLATGQEARRLNGHNGAYVVRFHPKQPLAATGGNGGMIHLFDVTTGQLLKTLTGHTGLVHGLGFSKDGKRLLSTCYDNSARIWDVEKGTELKRFMHTGAVHHGTLSPDGKRAVTTGLDNRVHIWDADTGKILHTLVHPGAVWQVVISPDGRRLYTGCGGGPYGGAIGPNKENSEIRVWDLQAAKELRHLVGHSNYVYSMSISADGRFLASGGHDGSMRVWGAK